MSGTNAIGDLREKIGDLMASLRAAQEQQKERHNDTREAIAQLSAELKAIKQQERHQESLLANKVEIIDLRLKAVEVSLTAVTTALVELKQANIQTHERLQELKEPVEEFVTIRRRIVAYAMAIGTLLTAIALLLQPLYEDLLKRMFRAIWP